MAISGYGGKVRVGAATVSEIGNWQLDIDAEMLDKTNFQSNGWKEFIAGLKEWTGSFEGTWNVAGDATGQKALQDALLGGTTVSLELFVNATNKYSGQAFVSGQSVETPTDDLVSVSFDIQGTGQLSYS
jgi:predicted secreted protein